jgi:hypothetical protein
MRIRFRIRHAARQLPSWLIFDVGRLSANITLMSIADTGRETTRVPGQKQTPCESVAAASRARRQYLRRARFTAARTALDVVVVCFRGRFSGLRVIGRKDALFISEIASRVHSPNKAPEPTPGLVTPRAMECAFEMKRQNEKRDAARGAPSPVVAHL